MSAFCLVRTQADKFIKGLRSGEINPEKLSIMTSEERHKFLAGFVGEENALPVNSLFESKLLLKRQQEGMISWAKKVSGLTPEARKDLITKIGKMDKILNPEEQKSFLKDLATTRIGADVTAEEAQNIFELSNKVKNAAKSLQDDFTFGSEEERLAYGRAKVELSNYVNDLKGNNNTSIKSLSDIAGVSKSLKASLDNSAIFRQGWKSMMTHPLTWGKNSLKTFSDAAKSLKGKDVLDEVMADRESRVNELNGNYKKMQLAVNKAEEAYPSSLPEKIPVLGRAFKASEAAYTGFVYRQRMDIADQYLKIAEKSGVDLTPKELKAIGSMVNSLTGRGDAGFLNTPAVNNVFFSPRFIKSQIDTLLHPVTGAGGSNFVRKQAAVNLVKVIAGTSAILAVADAVKPGSVEKDPRSSDFGKIRVKDTRFDVTGGMGALITLAARLKTNSTKSSTTGNVTEINSDKFGSKTGFDVVTDFFGNKLSPAGSVIKDIVNRKDFDGNPITVQGELKNLFVPIPITTYEELQKNPNSANIILSMIADGLGISTNTYSAKPPKEPKPKTTSSLNRKGGSLNRSIR